MNRATARLTALTVFLSSALMFLVEFAVGKAALPRFGGSPAIWVTSLSFFQLVLLGGYAWAAQLTRRPMQQARRWHLSAMGVLLALQVLLFFNRDNGFTAQSSVTGILVFLFCTVGPLLLLLSATAPLLQHWYSEASRSAPWWLYAVSNTGSLVSLLAYPFLIEPMMGLQAQGALVLMVTVVFVVAVNWSAARLKPGGETAEASGSTAAPALTFTGVLWWLLLSAAASVLLSSTSNTLCQDVAPTPLLWALPLGLYLLSFVVCFRTAHRFRPRFWVALWVLGLFFAGIDKTMEPSGPLLWSVMSYSLLQFSGSMLLHGQLFAARPEPAQLGRYYLLISVGGALGSMLVSVVAPLVFNDYSEFPLILGSVSLGIAGVVLLAKQVPAAVRMVTLAALGLFLMLWLRADDRRHNDQVASLRNFFGVLRVKEGMSGSTKGFSLVHGNIMHGIELRADAQTLQPTAYYTQSSGLGLALDVARTRTTTPLQVKALGLGIGAAARLLQSGEAVTFYEINPDAIALAEGRGGYFKTLQRTPAKVTVLLGDARKLLEAEAPPQPVDVLAVDVFSGDAIPTHLFTQEAFELYARHLKPDGLLLLHISNLHIKLAPVAFGLLQHIGFEGRLVTDATNNEYAVGSLWLVAAREPKLLDLLKTDQNHRVSGSPDVTRVWTDDFSTILPLLNR